MTNQNVQTVEAKPQPTVSLSVTADQQVVKPPAESADQKPPVKLPDAFQVLFLTASIYLLVFSYEWGFCRYFGIPEALIRPDLTTVLVYGALSLGVLFMLYQAISALFMIGDMLLPADGKKRPITSSLFAYAILFAFSGIAAWLEGFNGFWKSYYLLAIVGFNCLCDFLFPLRWKLSDKQKRPYVYHFEKWRKAHHETEQPFDKLLRKQGVSHIFAILLIVGISTYFSSTIGGFVARKTEEFLCRDTPRNEVVLRVYGSSAITARVDDKLNVYPEFRMVKMDDGTNEFLLKHLGTLKPQLPGAGVKSIVPNPPPVVPATNIPIPQLRLAEPAKQAPGSNALAPSVPYTGNITNRH